MVYWGFVRDYLRRANSIYHKKISHLSKGSAEDLWMHRNVFLRGKKTLGFQFQYCSNGFVWWCWVHVDTWATVSTQGGGENSKKVFQENISRVKRTSQTQKKRLWAPKNGKDPPNSFPWSFQPTPTNRPRPGWLRHLSLQYCPVTRGGPRNVDHPHQSHVNEPALP